MSAENGAVASFREANFRANQDVSAAQLAEHGQRQTESAVTFAAAGEIYTIKK